MNEEKCETWGTWDEEVERMGRLLAADPTILDRITEASRAEQYGYVIEWTSSDGRTWPR